MTENRDNDIRLNKTGLDDLFQRLGRAQDRALEQPAAATRRAAALSDRAAPAVQATHAPVQSRRPLIGVALAITALAAASVVLWSSSHPRPLTASAPTGAVTASMTMIADNNDFPVRFSDGSTATFRAGARGRMIELSDRGAEVELVQGNLVAHITHAERTRWVFRAGPFFVRVTGTKFDVAWSPQSRQLAVSLREGGVTVDGASLGAGVPLRAGQRLRVALADGSVVIEPLAPVDRLSPVAATPGAGFATAPELVHPAAARPSPNVSSATWRTLAKRGAHAEAWREARRLGVAHLQQRLDPAGLLALGDVARYSGAKAEAREIFLTLATRFPRHHLAGDAVFSLGRMASEGGDAEQATAWFNRYQRQWPTGALVPEAMGRLLEAAVARGNEPEARQAAHSYLGRAPTGAYAGLARQVLARPTGAEAADAHR